MDIESLKVTKTDSTIYSINRFCNKSSIECDFENPSIICNKTFVHSEFRPITRISVRSKSYDKARTSSSVYNELTSKSSVNTMLLTYGTEFLSIRKRSDVEDRAAVLIQSVYRRYITNLHIKKSIENKTYNKMLLLQEILKRKGDWPGFIPIDHVIYRMYRPLVANELCFLVDQIHNENVFNYIFRLKILNYKIYYFSYLIVI